MILLENTNNMKNQSNSQRGASPLTVVILIIVAIALAQILAMYMLRSRSPNVPQDRVELPVDDISYFDEAADSGTDTQSPTLTQTELENIAADGAEAYRYFDTTDDDPFIPEEILEHDELNLSTDQQATIEDERDRVVPLASNLASQLLAQEQEVTVTATEEGIQEDALREDAQASSVTFAELRSLILTSKQTIRETLTKEQITVLAS